MIEYFLAFVLLAHLDQSAPEMQSPHKTHEECEKARVEAIRATPEALKTKAAREAGATFVCLKIVGGT